MVIDLIVSVMLVLLGAGGVVVLQRYSEPWEYRYLWLSYGAHALSAVVMILLTQYFFGGGDLLAYQKHGATYASLLRSDFSRHAWDFFLYVTGQIPRTYIPFQGTSTGAMIGLSTWLHILFFGSLYGKCMFITIMGFFSKFMIYKGFAMFFNRKLSFYILISCMLLPSTVFWTSGMLKEPMAMIGMGPLVYGTSLFIYGRKRLTSLVCIVVGGFIVSIFKAYILFPWVIAMAVCFYWHRQARSGKALKLVQTPLYMVIMLAISVGGVVLLGELFPRYSISSLSTEIGNLQVIGQRTSGGSNYMVSSAPARDSSTQLLMLPLGLFFSLFRPFIFEARNAALLLNALETTFFLFLWGRLLFVQGIRRTIRLILGTPGLMGGVLFVILFGAVVGIATTNIGTLSRYRIPMMPFYASVLLLLSYAPKMSSQGTAR